MAALLATVAFNEAGAAGVFAGVAAPAIAVAALSGIAVWQATRPLHLASRAMQAIGEPQWNGMIPPSPIRELDTLATSFNAMAARLQASTSELAHQAYHDPLTGLPNRAFFTSRLTTALSRSAADGRDSVAVLFLDIDRFKYVNDTLGHHVGDELLSVLSLRLLAVVGSDHLAARLSGDEFTVLIEQSSEAEALAMATEIVTALDRPFYILNRELFATVSVGVALSVPGETSVTDLLRRADIALYRAKADPASRYSLFEPSLESADIALQGALHHVVERGELVLHYQPEVELVTGRIVGMEALVRWNHPHRGVLAPLTFLSLAAEAGELVKIGQWVLQEACRYTAELNRRPGADPLVVSVNLSGSEFREHRFVDHLAAVLRATGLPARQLRLEVPERVVAEDLPGAVATLTKLKRLGVHLALVDFGAEYASAGYLQRLPVDHLKIRRPFVAAVGKDAATASAIRAIVGVGRKLRREVTAEGVETLEQLQYLLATGCAHGQGYYFSHPLEAGPLRELLEQPEPAAIEPLRRAG